MPHRAVNQNKYQDRSKGRYFEETNGALQTHRHPSRFLAVDLQRQLPPGTFEHAMNHLIDHELDLSGFDSRLCNDVTGAAAYAQ